MNTQQAYEILKEYNQWRRGEGEYEWNDEPGKNKAFPYTPKMIGEALDQAIMVIGSAQRTEREGGRVIVTEPERAKDFQNDCWGNHNFYLSSNAIDDLKAGKCIILPVMDEYTATLYMDGKSQNTP